MVIQCRFVWLVGLMTTFVVVAATGATEECVTLSPFQLRIQGQDDSILKFIDERPFDAHIKTFCNAITSNIAYGPIMHTDNTISTPPSNATAVVVGKITGVRLLFISVASSNAHVAVAWYEANVKVVERRRGTFPVNTFSFLFCDHPGGEIFYHWPYLPGLVHVFSFSNKVLIDNYQVQNDRPYSDGSIRTWSQFRKERRSESDWIADKWLPTIESEGRVVNIHVENDDTVVILSVQPYGAIGPFFLNYNEVSRTAISLKTKSEVE